MVADDIGMTPILFKKTIQLGRSERRGESYSVPYVEPLSDVRTLGAVFVDNLLSIPFRVGEHATVHTLRQR